MLSVRILLIQLALHSQAMLFNLNSLFQQPKGNVHNSVTFPLTPTHSNEEHDNDPA